MDAARFSGALSLTIVVLGLRMHVTEVPDAAAWYSSQRSPLAYTIPCASTCADSSKPGGGTCERHQCQRGALDRVPSCSCDGVRGLRQPDGLCGESVAERSALGSFSSGG